MFAKKIVLVTLQENKGYLTKKYGSKELKCDNVQLEQSLILTKSIST
jgi:hypothetical protein